MRLRLAYRAAGALSPSNPLVSTLPFRASQTGSDGVRRGSRQAPNERRGQSLRLRETQGRAPRRTTSLSGERLTAGARCVPALCDDFTRGGEDSARRD